MDHSVREQPFPRSYCDAGVPAEIWAAIPFAGNMMSSSSGTVHIADHYVMKLIQGISVGPTRRHPLRISSQLIYCVYLLLMPGRENC